MNLQDLTLKQLKSVERVIYQDTYHFTDSDFFEYLCMMISESWGDDPEIRLFDDGTLLKIDEEVHWFEVEHKQRGVY